MIKTRHFPILASTLVSIAILVGFIILAGRGSPTTPTRLVGQGMRQAFEAEEIHFFGKFNANLHTTKKLRAYSYFDGVIQLNKANLAFLINMSNEIDTETSTEKNYNNIDITIKSTGEQISFHVNKFLLPNSARDAWQALLARFEARWYAFPMNLVYTNFGVGWSEKFYKQMFTKLKFTRTETEIATNEYRLIGEFKPDFLSILKKNFVSSMFLTENSAPKIEIWLAHTTKLPNRFRVSLNNPDHANNFFLDITFNYTTRQTEINPLIEPIEFDPRILNFF